MKKRVKKALKNSGILILYSLFMFGIAFIAFRIGRESTTRFDEFNLGSLLITTGLVIIFASAIVYLHIIIHELGHLVTGILSGYTFMLFRIGSLGIIREEEGFKTISFSIRGTMGQCLMHPPESTDKSSFWFYLSGGVMANVITSSGALLIYWVNPNDYLLLFAFIGLTAGLMNGIPFGFNDGKILSKLSKSTVAQDQFFQQLKWNGEFVRHNRTYSDVAEDAKIINAQEPITEQFNVYTKLIEMNTLLEQKQFNEAYRELSDLYDYRKDIIVPYQSEVMREYLFCLLVLDIPDTGVVNEIRSNRLFKEHLKTKQVDVYRIKSVIAYFIDNDRTEAEKQFDLSVDHLEKAPTYADKEVNRILLDYLKEVMKF